MSAPTPRKRKRKQRHRGHFPRPVASAPATKVDGKISVMLAFPTVDGNVNHSIAMAIGWAVQASYQPDFPFAFTIHVEPGVRGIEYARNRIVNRFMDDTTCEWLYMIDQDQVVPGNFWQLCLVDNADIISGLTNTWMGAGSPYAMLRVNQYSLDKDNQCFNIAPPPEAMATGAPYFAPIVGTGCIAIRRKVFEKLGRNRFYFTRYEDGRIRGGEDINFCVDAQRAGFRVAAHAGVKFGHVKSIDIGQIATFYEARHAFDNQGGVLTPADTLSISA